MNHRVITVPPQLASAKAVLFSFLTLVCWLGRPQPACSAPPMPAIEMLSQVPAGLLGRSQGRLFLILAGSPEEMGTAHGRLLAPQVGTLVDRVLYGVGGAESVMSGEWFIDTSAEIARRTSPHIPKRFVAECDAMSQAAGISIRDGRYANLFPERFHCSGIAVRGKATTDGQVVHARVLDYMRDIGLQRCAVTMVFMPQGHYAWISSGYSGLIGTVTAMNDQHLAMGEMGGGGVGDWDGMPMTFLMRDVMERAASVDEAVRIIQQTPRTCEYHYVLSDKAGAMVALHCTKDAVTILRPGEDHPRLPPIPEDTILISGRDRAEVAASRIREHFGKIDAAAMMEIIKRPVSMRSNLHNAIFKPATLEIWTSEAGRDSPACDEPYVYCTLPDLINFYNNAKRQSAK